MFRGRQPTNAEIASLLGLGNAPAPSMAMPQFSFPAPRFVPTGTIKPTPKSIAGSIQATIAKGLQKVGIGERQAHRFASRSMLPLTDATPIGNVTGAEEGKNTFKRGLTKGDLGTMALGAGSFLLSAAPLPGAVKRGGKKLGTGMFGSMLKDKGGTFGGVNARTADLNALKRAEAMAGGGASRDDIWRDTGWFKGVDGKWRFEIPDNHIYLDRAKIDPNISAKRDVNRYMQKHYGVDDFLSLPVGSPQRTEANSLYQGFAANAAKKTQLLEDVAQHPELLEAYPPFRHIGVGAETAQGLNGSWFGDSGTLRVRPSLDHAGVNSTLGHELQHAVQDAENFAIGGMPGDDNLAEGLTDTKAIREAYRRLAGEVEARNVQARLWMSPEERRAKAPWLTQDYPDDQQIVRFRPR